MILAGNGTVGEAELRMTTNDPDAAVVTVALSAVANTPPTAVILAPDDTARLVGDVLLQGVTSDLEHDLTTLNIAWTSSLDGVIGTAPASLDGLLAEVWTPPRTIGDHVLTLTVEDTCGEVASDTVRVRQD